MGRMLDSLNQVNGQHGSASEAKEAAPPAATPMPVPPAPPSRDDEAFPYVEVGGPGKKMDASPCMLAAGAATPKKGSSAPTASTKVSSPPSLVPTLTEPQPPAARLETWPASRSNSAMARDIIAFHQPDHAI